jgi:hypothetical protein
MPDAAGWHDADMNIACTLGAKDMAAQTERWRSLMAAAAVGRDETPDGLRIRFRPDPGVETELTALVATERECCAWATWTVTADAGAVMLEIRSQGDGVAALRAMLAGASA